MTAIAAVSFFPVYKPPIIERTRDSKLAAPRPCKIRHSIRLRKFGAKAHKTPPRANTSNEGIRIRLKPKRSAKIPKIGVPSATGIKKAAIINPMRSPDTLNASAILGSIGLTLNKGKIAIMVILTTIKIFLSW